MGLTDENGMNTTMLVSPAGNVGTPYPYPYPMQQNGNGFGDSNGWWIILLLVVLFSGNLYGNNGNNGGNGWGAGPVIVNDGGSNGSVQRGFDQAAVMGGINGISASVQGIATQLCECCADMQQAMMSAFFNAETAANSRQMATTQQLFGMQTANSQGFNQLGLQLAQASADNRLATCQTQNAIQNEGSMTRFADANNTRDILTAFNAGIQSVKDQLCDYRNAQKDDIIAQLRQELMYSRGQASQVEQTAQILANNNAQTALMQQGFNSEVDALYNRLNNCPVPSTPVYGRTPIFTCPQNPNNSGCPCNGSM
jgi:hypothetical protein